MALPPPNDLIAFGEASHAFGVDGYVHQGFAEWRRGQSFGGGDGADRSPKPGRVDLFAEGD